MTRNQIRDKKRFEAASSNVSDADIQKEINKTKNSENMADVLPVFRRWYPL